MKFPRKAREPVDINLAPLIDVVFILLLFFVVTTTFTRETQLKVDLPEELVKEALKCKTDAEAEQVGIEWCVAQCKELMSHGVPSIHFYSIGAVDSIKEVAKIIY